MASVDDSSGLLTVGGLLTLGGGFAVVSLSSGEAGLTLVLGGALLLISAVGVRIHDPRPTPR